MTASMFQGEGGYMDVVGNKPQAHPPGMTPAMSQGSEGPVMSDLQTMMANEQKQHESTYRYANGNGNGGNMPLGNPSF